MSHPDSSLTLKRSHSPDQDALHTPHDQAYDHNKRQRADESRPALADAYLDCLSKNELVHLIRQIEQWLNDTPQAPNLYALLYPANLHERIQDQAHQQESRREHSAGERSNSVISAAMPLPQPSSSMNTASAAPASSTGISPAPTAAVARPYTPSIPAVANKPAPVPTTHAVVPSSTTMSATTESLPSNTLQSTSHAPLSSDAALSSSATISSRIAAILESIHSSNANLPFNKTQDTYQTASRLDSHAASGVNTSANATQLNSAHQNLSSSRFPANSALTKLLEQNGSLSFSRTDTHEPGHRYVPQMDVPRPTPGPFDYNRLGTSSSSLSSQHNPLGHVYQRDANDDNGASHRDPARVTSTLPSYEDMIVEGLEAIGDVNGTPPRMLFHWMEDTYPLMKNFRPSASQALQKAFKRGRLHKVGSLYRINPDWDGSNTGRKPTRRPQVGKDHPMMVNGPKGPAPASPFKARAQYQGAAAYRQTTSPFSKQRNAHSRLLQSLRPGPKPYGQPGAAPLDNPASSIFQNGAAAAALLLAHQQRSRNQSQQDGAQTDSMPSLTDLIQQLRASNYTNPTDPSSGTPSSLTSMLASALLKHVQRPGFSTTPGVEPSAALSALTSQDSPVDINSTGSQQTSAPVLQSLSRLLGTRGEQHPVSKPMEDMEPEPQSESALPSTAPNSLSASIEMLMRQASRAVQTSQGSADDSHHPHASASQADLDAAVSQTLEAAFQEIGPSDASNREQDPAGAEANELAGIDLSDYSDALRTLTAALTGTNSVEDDEENERHLADERAIADAEADLSDTQSQADDDSHETPPAHSAAAHSESSQQNPDDSEESSESRMASLLKSYGVDVSGEAVKHLTETLRDPSHPLPVEANIPSTADVPTQESLEQPPETTSEDTLSDAAKNQAIQSQLEALIASLAQDGGGQSDEES
ncbi:hypothetical protein MPSI1_002417 [Malassezia psittaci]|uniref:Histone H1 n=1 Tax=Malassezia psittaci TaxID=1821823 RepID=A0AAF0JEI5_9BASI|nr:hypothetical protein MPSI1_002417 [Malassezia psittaci]